MRPATRNAVNTGSHSAGTELPLSHMACASSSKVASEPAIRRACNAAQRSVGSLRST